MASRQHGLTTMNATRPKSKLGKRRNKAKARDRKAILLKALDDALTAARSGKTVKAPQESSNGKAAEKAPKKESTVEKSEKEEAAPPAEVKTGAPEGSSPEETKKEASKKAEPLQMDLAA